MGDTYPLLAAIVLNWNSPADTLQCLETLLQSAYPALHIIVVDNGSTDDSVAQIRAAHPDITLLETGANLGYGEGNNIGMRYALVQNMAYVVLLNNDAFVRPDTLQLLVAAAEADPTIATTGGKVLYASAPHRIWAVGRVVLPTESDTDDGGFDAPMDVTYIAGCCMVIRCEVLKRVGLLDPEFFIYFDEYDWCVRARNLGYRARYVPEAMLFHAVSTTIGQHSPLYYYLFTRNKLRFWERCGIIPSDWRRVKGLCLVGCEQLLLALHQRTRRLACIRAVLWGLADYTRGRFGAPPEMLVRR
jgi:hypothetical protein